MPVAEQVDVVHATGRVCRPVEKNRLKKTTARQIQKIAKIVAK